MKRTAVWSSVVGVVILVASLVIGLYLAVWLNPGTTAPWFGTSLFTLSGAISGAFIAGGFALWLEYQKREADLALADSRLQREASVEFLSQVVKYFNKAYSPNTKVSDDAVMTSWTAFQLVCNRSQIQSAEELLHSAMYFVPLRRGHVDDDVEPEDTCVDCDEDPYVDEALKWYKKCKLKFSNDLRRQYGIEELPDLPYEAQKPAKLTEQVRKDMSPRQFLVEEIAEFLEAEQENTSSEKSDRSDSQGTRSG